MKYFLDTEFIESRDHLALISIGIACEDGRQYHEISTDYDWYQANSWVKEFVLMPLYTQTVHGDQRNDWDVTDFNRQYGQNRRTIRSKIIDLCAGDSDIEFYGYYSDYDWVVFCWIFGSMMDLPKGFPMYCMDIKQMMQERGLTKEWKQEHCPDPKDEHNALADAKWNMKLFNLIKSIPIK